MKKKKSDVNRNKYTIPGGAAYQLRSKNALYVSPANTPKHELSKCIIGYMLRKKGDFKFSDKLINLISEVDKEIKKIMKPFPKGRVDFISEAVPKTATLKEKGVAKKDRRVDLVNLETNDWIEIETNKKTKKEESITIYI